MLSKFKITAVALAALVASATFAASTEQAEAAKLSNGARVAIGVGAAILTGVVIANRQRAVEEGSYGYHGRRWSASDDDGDFGDDGPNFGRHGKRRFNRFDD